MRHCSTVLVCRFGKASLIFCCIPTQSPYYLHYLEKYLGLASIVECDVPTVCDDVCEDIEMWIRDLTEDEESHSTTPKMSNEVYSGYIPYLIVIE